MSAVCGLVRMPQINTLSLSFVLRISVRYMGNKTGLGVFYWVALISWSRLNWSERAKLFGAGLRSFVNDDFARNVVISAANCRFIRRVSTAMLPAICGDRPQCWPWILTGRTIQYHTTSMCDFRFMFSLVNWISKFVFLLTYISKHRKFKQTWTKVVNSSYIISKEQD